jgi:hypothetical protein
MFGTAEPWATADMDNFTWSSGSFSPLPSWPGWSGAYDQVHSPAGQNRNGAVASAVPSALTRGTGPLRLALAGATRSGSAGVGSLNRSGDEAISASTGVL